MKTRTSGRAFKYTLRDDVPVGIDGLNNLLRVKSFIVNARVTEPRGLPSAHHPMPLGIAQESHLHPGVVDGALF